MLKIHRKNVALTCGVWTCCRVIRSVVPAKNGTLQGVRSLQGDTFFAFIICESMRPYAFRSLVWDPVVENDSMIAIVTTMMVNMGEYIADKP